MYSILNFGKHNGKSLPEVLLHDPDYFFWAIENRVLEKSKWHAAEARDLNFKARNIKIPKPDTERWCVNYLFDHRDKFCGFNLAPVSSAPEAHPNRLDLSVGYRHKQYDKLGNKLLLRDFKKYYFGDGSRKFTRPQCEDFFDNAANFYKPTKPECHTTQVGHFSTKKLTWNGRPFEHGTISEEKNHAIN